MRLREAIISLFHLFIISFCCVMAVLFFGCAMRPSWQMRLVTLVEQSPHTFYWVGGWWFLAFLIFMVGFYGAERGRFMRLLVKPYPITVDARLLRQAVGRCMQTHFPRNCLYSDVVLYDQRLEVVLELLPSEEKRRQRLLHAIEQQLTYLLRTRFGYSKPFTIHVQER